MASHPASRRSRRQHRRPATMLMVAATGAVAVVVGAAVANAAMSNPASYRLAQVTTGSPNPALTAVGTIQPARQSTLTFPMAGRVATVAVHQGQSVIGGQLLAALDTTSLSAQLVNAESTVVAARARLSADQNAQSAATSTAGSGAGSGGSTPSAAVMSATSRTAAGGGTVTAATASRSTMAALQKPLIADQHTADAVLHQARTALAQATAMCRAAAVPQPSLDVPPTPSPTPATTGAPSDVPTAAATGSPQPATSAPPPASRSRRGGPESSVHSGIIGPPSTRTSGPPACDTAESRALALESSTYQDEQKVRTDEVALDRALMNAAGRSTARALPRPSTSVARPTGAASASGTARNAAPTAEQLAADQSAIDAATAQQQVAEQSLDQAKLFSPDAGTVQSVTFHVGDEISAGSTTENAVISSPGGEQAVVSVPVTDIASVSEGQHAIVTPDGSATAFTGTVTSIAILPTGSSYPVTVTLDGGTTVPDGSTATVALLAGTDRGTAMVVPTSAVIARGRGYAVQVDDHGTITTVPVTIGASGPVYTQITRGLTTGQEVVIANLAAPLPTSNTGVRGFVGGGPGGPAVGRAGGGGAGGTGREGGPGAD